MWTKVRLPELDYDHLNRVKSDNREWYGDESGGTFSWRLREAQSAADIAWQMTRRAPFIDGYMTALKKHGIFNDKADVVDASYVVEFANGNKMTVGPEPKNARGE
jgi:hypothetical protein